MLEAGLIGREAPRDLLKAGSIIAWARKTGLNRRVAKIEWHGRIL
jgi:hypothetical protein